MWDANGVWIGYRILRQTVTLAPDGKSFTGIWSNDRTDINGNIVSHIDADIVGTRVEVVKFGAVRVLRFMGQSSRRCRFGCLLSE